MLVQASGKLQVNLEEDGSQWNYDKRYKTEELGEKSTRAS
jgi:hypothetical protein